MTAPPPLQNKYKNQVGIQLHLSPFTPIRKKGFVWFRGLMRWDKENQDMSQDISKKNKNYVKQALDAPGACECICYQLMFDYPQ